MKIYRMKKIKVEKHRNNNRPFRRVIDGFMNAVFLRPDPVTAPDMVLEVVVNRFMDKTQDFQRMQRQVLTIFLYLINDLLCFDIYMSS